jgi:quercetin 2,3-dioxygenase
MTRGTKEEPRTMLRVRRSEERGSFDHGWLQTRHTFSFAGYHDPRHMGFRSLRVINEDVVEAGRGFGAHPHRDMEIVTYVSEGALRHEDSMGNGGVIRAGEVQRMTAGTGVTHSEMNDSPREPVHLFQIWILPEREGLEPSYEQGAIVDDGTGSARPVAGPPGSGALLSLHQDALFYVIRLAPGYEEEYRVAPERGVWVQVARGHVEVDGEALHEGDGAAMEQTDLLRLATDQEGQGAEVLLFDLA